MAGWTNRGKLAIMEAYFKGTAQYIPGGFSVALFTSATAPDADDNVASDLTECPNGFGYVTGGLATTRGDPDFGVTEDDTNDRARADIADRVWTAAGGNMPSTAARYCGLLDDDTTPNLLCYGDLTSDRQVSDTQTLTLQNWYIDLTE